MGIFTIFKIFGGLAMFLYGMNVMGDGLKKLGGSKLESILETLTKNKFMGVLLGTVVTAVIQSSSATTVMVVGFVNSGIMKLSQSISVMMGASIGTTMTAWILSLSGVQGESIWANILKPENFTPVLGFIGIILIMFTKNEKKNNLGNILVGFAVLMFGMTTMSSEVKSIQDNPALINVITTLSNPVIGVIVGMFITAAIQSSSASIGILQALSATGQITFVSAIPYIVGANVGASISALISSLGASKNAKRAAICNLYYKLISAVLFLILMFVLNAFIDMTILESSTSAVTIAVVHTVFNVLAAAVLLPFTSVIEKLARLTIREGAERSAFAVLDDRFLATPSYAVEQSLTLAVNMAYIAKDSFTMAQDCVASYSERLDKQIIDNERETDEYEDALSVYLIKLSAQQLSIVDAQKVSILLSAISDFEKMTDYTTDLVFTAREKHNQNVHFSEKARQEITIMVNAVGEAIDLTINAFSDNDVKLAYKVEPLEDVIDHIRNDLKNRHIHRMQEGRCPVEQGFIFTDYINALEKISDHCSNVASAIIELNNDNYDIHNVMSNRRIEEGYKEQYAYYAEKYSLPFSKSSGN